MIGAENHGRGPQMISRRLCVIARREGERAVMRARLAPDGSIRGPVTIENPYPQGGTLAQWFVWGVADGNRQLDGNKTP
jgi:hypothetical protein